jgi:hypothetical protein
MTISLGQAIAEMANTQQDTQMQTAETVLSLMQCSLPLNESYSEKLDQEMQKYAMDSRIAATPGNQEYSAIAAQDYAQYQFTSNEMDRVTLTQNTTLNSQQSALSSQSSAMDNVFDLAESPKSLLKNIERIIRSFK